MADELVAYHYKLPFRTPFRNAHSVISERRGILAGNGSDIWTEIAPLPGFSPETLDEAISFLKKHHIRLQSHFQEGKLDLFLKAPGIRDETAELPSVRFGLSMLSEQQKAMAAGLPLYSMWLGRTSSAVIRLNAITGNVDPESLYREVRTFQSAGYSCIKVKLPESPDDAFTIIAGLCRQFPDILFRFDANRVYTPDQAGKLLARLQNEDRQTGICRNIEYIEEPAGFINERQLPNLLSDLRKHGIPIAADESGRSPMQVRSLAARNAVDALVLKPMLFGAFDEMMFLEKIPLPVTVSSSFETAVGRMLLGHLAGYFNGCVKIDKGVNFDKSVNIKGGVRKPGGITDNETGHNTSHGIATGHLFSSDIPYRTLTQTKPDLKKDDPVESHASDLSPKQASYGEFGPVLRLPESPGLGIIPDLSTGIVNTKHNILKTNADQ